HRALKKLIRKKVKGEEVVIPEKAEEPAEVVDLMEALKASVEAARKGKPPKAPRSSERERAGDGAVSDEDLSTLTKRELEEHAKELDVSGRSRMDKKQLIRAIRKSA
ncbi:MAG: Rho termination factor N-terminal domain-containing protein, partial [Actinomycetota bacterium]